MFSANAQSIDAITQAIQRVLANASRQQLIIDRPLIWVLIQFVTTLFDPTTARCWKIRVMRDEPTFDTLVNFLFDFNSVDGDLKKQYKIPKIGCESKANEAGTSGAQSLATKGKGKKKGAAERNASPASSQAHLFKRPRPSADPRCAICNGNHEIRDCPRFLKMSLKDRETELYRRNICINCLSTTHTVKFCLDNPCKICKKRHNSMLHHCGG